MCSNLPVSASSESRTAMLGGQEHSKAEVSKYLSRRGAKSACACRRQTPDPGPLDYRRRRDLPSILTDMSERAMARKAFVYPMDGFISPSREAKVSLTLRRGT